MNTALVTGASGMLGTSLTEQLTRAGWHVRALVRTPGTAPWLESIGATVHQGDLADIGSLRRAADGCCAVFHAAAAVDSRGTWEAFRAANVGGTSNVVEAAAAAGARLVHVSTTAVYGQSRYYDHPTSEADALPQLPANDFYGRSKQEAEALVLAAHAAGRVWATVVRPPAMYGRRDRQFAPRIGPFLLAGIFPLINEGRSRMSLVSAASVADGAVRAALCAGAGGRVYLLANDVPITVANLITYASRGLGRRVRRLRLTHSVGRRAFRGLQVALLASGRRDLAAHVPGVFQMLTCDNPFTSARAHAELGWAPQTDPAIALADAFEWWNKSRRAPRQMEER